jgi:hypothetical protein
MLAYHIIHGHNIVCMTLEENSQDKSFTPYNRTITSEMCTLLPRILNLMPCAKECTKCRKHPKNFVTRRTTPRYGQRQGIHQGSLINCYMHAMRAAIHSTLGSSPRSLTFNRDMLLNIPLIANWHTIPQRQGHLINENLVRENQKHCQYNYVSQQRVLKKR